MAFVIAHGFASIHCSSLTASNQIHEFVIGFPRGALGAEFHRQANVMHLNRSPAPPIRFSMRM
jgi:hypothetical protein